MFEEEERLEPYQVELKINLTIEYKNCLRMDSDTFSGVMLK